MSDLARLGERVSRPFASSSRDDPEWLSKRVAQMRDLADMELFRFRPRLPDARLIKRRRPCAVRSVRRCWQASVLVARQVDAGSRPRHGWVHDGRQACVARRAYRAGRVFIRSDASRARPRTSSSSDVGGSVNVPRRAEPAGLMAGGSPGCSRRTRCRPGSAGAHRRGRESRRGPVRRR